MAQSTKYEDIVEASKNPHNKVEERVYAVWKGAGENVAPWLELPVLVTSSVFNTDTVTIANSTIKSTVAAVACGTAAFVATGGLSAPLVLGAAALGSAIAGIEGAFEAKKTKKNNPAPPFTEEERQNSLNEMAQIFPNLAKNDLEKIVRPSDKPKNKLEEAAHTIFVGAVAPTTTLIGGSIGVILIATAGAINYVFQGAKKALGIKNDQIIVYQEEDVDKTNANNANITAPTLSNEIENPAKSNPKVQEILSAKDLPQPEQIVQAQSR